jgi:hypothetical protein
VRSSTISLPPINYLAVYRANLRAPEADLCVASTPEFEIKLSPGPVEFSFTIPVVRHTPPVAGLTPAQRHVKLAPDSYVLIRIRVDAPDATSARTTAALRAAEAACVFDLRYPGLLAEKVYEGTVDEPGRFIFMGEGPLRISAQPDRDPKDVADRMATDFGHVEGLPEAERARFQLAARWFRRGQEAINPVDRFLFFWTVLEIYPAGKQRKQPKRPKVANIASKFLREHLYQDLSDEQIKKKAKIGHIGGLRDDIVHQGWAFVKREKEEEFSDHLERLETIAATCLRILAGMPPGDDLNKYVRES